MNEMSVEKKPTQNPFRPQRNPHGVTEMSRAHSPTFPSLRLHHNSFSNPSVASPTSQLILQPFFRFSYVTSSLLNLPGESPMHQNHHDITNITKLPTIMVNSGAKGSLSGISGSLIWSKTLMELIFNPCAEFR